ncbi:acyl-CoA thioesterase [Bacteroides ilei]|jgi:acyl-CoA thioester hydrolase|uniref:acyl-CoA thioesterase n=1 Tax=Bacteroides ilei TaxID=1907658 RepID=UPI00092FF1D0|nr:thioesterase family protein [Bacteroides ilei]
MADDVKFRHVLPVQIRFSDVDQYGHMNNSSYFSLYDLAKTSYIREVFGERDWKELGIVVANINADFLAPVFFSDELEIETTVIHLGHKSFTLLQRAYNKASGVLKCQCRTVMVGYDILTKEPVDLPDDFKEAVCRYEEKTLEELSQPIENR